MTASLLHPGTFACASGCGKSLVPLAFAAIALNQQTSKKWQWQQEVKGVKELGQRAGCLEQQQREAEQEPEVRERCERCEQQQEVRQAQPVPKSFPPCSHRCGRQTSLAEQLWANAVAALQAEDFAAKSGMPLIIFDWDDSLMPTTAFRAALAAEATIAAEAARAGSVPSTWKEEDWSACEVAGVMALQAAKEIGRVLIVTNAEEGWVEESAGRRMPRLLAALQGVPVISAGSIFGPQGVPQWHWKAHCFERIAELLQDESILAGKPSHPARLEGQSVSVGDSLTERSAALEVARSRHIAWNVTTVKLREGPTVRELTAQLQLCARHLPHILPVSGSLDLVMSEEDEVRLEPAASQSQMRAHLADLLEVAGKWVMLICQ